jgi:hypothetical protein
MEALISTTFYEVAVLLVLASAVGYFAGVLLRQPLIVSFIVVFPREGEQKQDGSSWNVDGEASRNAWREMSIRAISASPRRRPTHRRSRLPGTKNLPTGQGRPSLVAEGMAAG